MIRTVETLRQILAIDRVAYRIIYGTFQSWLKTLHKVFKATEHKSPKETATALAKEIGRNEANVLVGSIVNYYAYDGRIEQCVINWAAGIEGVCDGSAAQMLGLNDCKIHLANLNQIAIALMSYRKG